MACVSLVTSVRSNLLSSEPPTFITQFYSPFSGEALQPPLFFSKQYLWKVAVRQRTVTESLQRAQAVVGSQVADKAYIHPVRSDVVFCSHAAGKIHSAAHELKKKMVLKAHTRRIKSNSF